MTFARECSSALIRMCLQLKGSSSNPLRCTGRDSNPDPQIRSLATNPRILTGSTQFVCTCVIWDGDHVKGSCVPTDITTKRAPLLLRQEPLAASPRHRERLHLLCRGPAFLLHRHIDGLGEKALHDDLQLACAGLAGQLPDRRGHRRHVELCRLRSELMRARKAVMACCIVLDADQWKVCRHLCIVTIGRAVRY